MYHNLTIQTGCCSGDPVLPQVPHSFPDLV